MTSNPTRPIAEATDLTGARSELLTLAEAAELLRTPVATLRYWRHLGTGPTSFKLGKRVLYRRADIAAWLAAQLARQAGGDDGFGDAA